MLPGALTVEERSFQSIVILLPTVATLPAGSAP
jgi:hypothetical protein